tara:strand:+ start:25385 stop:26374 length:990 start_codon:yes stop_codon:yes gene_type:complete
MKTKDKPLTINAIKTNIGMFLEVPGWADLSQHIRVNGKNVEKTWKTNWYKADTDIKKVERINRVTEINHRYEIIDESFVNLEKGIKPSFSRDEVAEWDDDEYEYCWIKEYAHLESLYNLKHDLSPECWVEIDFKLNILGRYKGVEEPEDFSFPGYTLGSWPKNKQIKSESIIFDKVDQMLFPDLLLHQKKCELSSVETYGIVRRHIKENINLKYAEITSDYDFCFTVKKKIPIEPKSFFYKSYPSNRTVKGLKTDRNTTIFEMTHSKKGYQDYTIINGFKGKSANDLKNKIEIYLKYLMESINAPIVECECCKGSGAVIEEIGHDIKTK